MNFNYGRLFNFLCTPFIRGKVLFFIGATLLAGTLFSYLAK